MKIFANSNLGFAFQPKDRIQFLSIHYKKKSILQVHARSKIEIRSVGNSKNNCSQYMYQLFCQFFKF